MARLADREVDAKTPNRGFVLRRITEALAATDGARLQAVGPGDVVGRLAEPVVIAETTTPVSASVGLVEVHRDDERAAEEILRDADRAMYEAKRARRGSVCP